MYTLWMLKFDASLLIYLVYVHIPLISGVKQVESKDR